MGENKPRIEEFEVNGTQVVETVKRIVHEGNIRRITIKDGEGRSLIEVPLSLGVVGAVLLPVWAALGAAAALLARCTIVVERLEE